MADPVKILHLIGTLGHFDTSWQLRALARSQSTAGCEVVVSAFSAPASSRRALEDQGIKTAIIRKRWPYDPFASRQLVQQLRHHRPTIVHLWGRRGCDASLTVRRALPHAGLVATLTKIPQLRNPWWPNKSFDALDAIVLEREELRAPFVDAGLGAEQVHIIPPGISQPRAEVCSRRELLTHLSLPSEARLIAIAGPLARWQLVDEAIWCFELVRILHEHMSLVIVGEGPERARLERFTRQVTNPTVVRLIPREQILPDLLAHAEIYWQPGNSFTIPSALLAALGRGLPVVASAVPAHRDAIIQGENGFLVPPAKRAEWARRTDQLLRSPELRTKFAECARQTVADKFSLPRMTASYNQLYRKIDSAIAVSC